jgi:sensor histidine kinase regulating citrate/malate metabolism
MTKHEQDEAERIADELMKTHTALVTSGQLGLQPHAMQTFKLARAIQIFSATAEPEKLSDLARKQRAHDAR